MVTFNLRFFKTVIGDFMQSFTEPSSQKLLPDELPFPYQRPYTVVLELNDVLMHTEYDVSTAKMI